MRATLELDVKDGEAVSFVLQALRNMTGVGGFSLSFEDEYGTRWSNSGQGTVVEVPRPKDSAVVALEQLAETFDEWAGNVDYNNSHGGGPREDWAGRARGFREAAIETRLRKRALL